MREITYRQALNEALKEEMRRDDSIIIMGEDIGDYGGPFKVTTNLINEFSKKRVIDTPISECAFTGAAIGAAITGLRPIIEILYIDFVTVAMDQIINQAAKLRFMSGGSLNVPMVIRTQGGAGAGEGSQHSQSLEAWFAHIPGLKVVMPSTPYDAKGLLKSAIRDNNPVIFIEHKLLYPIKGNVPEKEYIINLGEAAVRREGKDITVVTYSQMVQKALKASDILSKNGIEVEVVDLRTLVPLDIMTIIKSIEKTGRLLVISEACRTGCFSEVIIDRIVTNRLDYIDCIDILAGADFPVPYAYNLERIIIPQVDNIINKIEKMVG